MIGSRIARSRAVVFTLGATLAACAMGDDPNVTNRPSSTVDVVVARPDVRNDAVSTDVRTTDTANTSRETGTDARTTGTDATVAPIDASTGSDARVTPPADARPVPDVVCTGTETNCNGACVDTQTTAAHCGACDTACAASMVCAAGACACPSGQTMCGTTCVDLQANDMHCGACATVCATMQVCAAGTCRAVPPANDTLAGATVIDATGAHPATTITANTASATHDVDVPASCGTCAAGPDVFYRFTLTATEIVYADTIGSTYDTAILFADATGHPLTDAALTGGAVCNNDNGLGCNTAAQSMIAAKLGAGTYTIVLAACGAGGTATLHFQHSPVGNGPVGALTGTTGTTQVVTGATSGAGIVSLRGATGCLNTAGPENTYWFVTCPDFAAATVTASTCDANTNYDTVVYTASPGATPLLTCNDDATCAAASTSSTETAMLPAGAGLHTVMVDGYLASSAGNYTLAVTIGACATGSALCNNRCIPTTSDNANCGACGHACGAGSACAASVCTCTGATPTMCGASCTSTVTDSANCGTCGHVCAGGQVCGASACACPASAPTTCGSTCVNTMTSNANCGACGTVCGTGLVCGAGVCRPANDARANATMFLFGSGLESTLHGTTVDATHDGPANTCGACAMGPDVWYRFALGQRAVVYFDTAGSADGFNTAIELTDAGGAAVANLCNDDGFCTANGFSADGHQSQIGGFLDPGTYYVGVSGCGTGAFTLHAQGFAVSNYTTVVSTPLYGVGTVAGTASADGSSQSSGSCGGASQAETAYWFTTCGGAGASFSTCAAQGGADDNDTLLYVESAGSQSELACNNNTGDTGHRNCARTAPVMLPRGLGIVVVDQPQSDGGGFTCGFLGACTYTTVNYTLAYTLP